MRGGVNPWPDEAVAILRAGIEAGRSAAQIRDDLAACGYAHTRNSVIGKAHRLGLAGGGQPATRALAMAPAERAPRPPAAKPPPIMRPPVRRGLADDFLAWRKARGPVDGGLPLGVAPLEACSWPVAGVGKQLRVCGAVALKGCSYCGPHMREAHKPTGRVNTFVADGSIRTRRAAEKTVPDLCEMLGGLG